MKILLFGKNGLLGSALVKFLSRAHEVASFSHEECDICDEKSVRSAIKKTKPDLVINATGYTNVDKAEQEEEKAFSINEKGVENIAKNLESSKIPLIHFSTDYIFDGGEKEGYVESDSPSPLSVYGASKAAGEKAIVRILKNFYIVRTAWLYGPGGKNFVDTILSLAQKNEQLRVVADQMGSPTFTFDLADAVANLIKSALPFGIYHLVNEGSLSWYEFAVEIFHQLGVPKQIIPITAEELARPARRPKFSFLRNTKFAKLRPWKEALKEYLQNKTLIL